MRALATQDVEQGWTRVSMPIDSLECINHGDYGANPSELNRIQWCAVARARAGAGRRVGSMRSGGTRCACRPALNAACLDPSPDPHHRENKNEAKASICVKDVRVTPWGTPKVQASSGPSSGR